MHIPAMMIIKGEVAEEVQATAQALYTGTFNNLSALIGSCIGEGLNRWQADQYPNSSKQDKQYFVGMYLFSICMGLTLITTAVCIFRMIFRMKRTTKEKENLHLDSAEKTEEAIL
jgi:hypothetical protein